LELPQTNFCYLNFLMNQLIFATNNQHKADEIKVVLGNLFAISTLKEAGIDIDIPEPHDTLEANATEKSLTIYKLTGKNCFSEDTGLEVRGLNGEPGVKSARYAGEGRLFDTNIDKLLDKMAALSNRQASFRTVISLILNGREIQFEGICEGARKDAAARDLDTTRFLYLPEVKRLLLKCL
jgi:XTP/dITP diphosphohydrolase